MYSNLYFSTYQLYAEIFCYRVLKRFVSFLGYPVCRQYNFFNENKDGMHIYIHKESQDAFHC